MHWRTSPLAVVAALAAVYAFGHVAGSLLADRRDDRTSISWAVVRLISGLLLTTVSFFLSLVLSLPWFIGPAGVLVAAVALHRGSAFSLPRPSFAFRWDAAAAGLLGAIVLSPIVISAARMAPGDFPPLFYNVDSPYFLEQVQSLAKTETYPPESLSNLGGRRSYHFATHGIAALISRSTGLAPHQSLFLIVLPLLATGMVAAAVAAARAVSPLVPAVISVPLLLLAVPSFWYSFWDVIGPLVAATASTRTIAPLEALADNYELWGAASIVGQNIGAHFVVLASLAAMAAAPARGWRLPVFLIGTAILVKTSAGVALVAGFLLVELWRSMETRRFRASMPAIAVVGAFAATYVAFWILPPVEREFAIEPSALFHLKRVAARGGLVGFAADLLWLFLPVAIVGMRRAGDAWKQSLPLLLVGVAPFVVVNMTHSIDARPGGGGATDDWLQLLLPAPLLLHAFVLSVASRRWPSLGSVRRTAFVSVMALTILPPIFVAGRYSRVLIREYDQGHEFVDNRSIAEALAAIPTAGSIVVTNDLRYPAQRFNRANRQMQIPALFGHQAFAVNFAYENFAFSRDRLELQALLEADEWSDAIPEAARTYGWTHLLIHKDYRYPAPIPLERVFENASYEVFRFSDADVRRGTARPSIAGPAR